MREGDDNRPDVSQSTEAYDVIRAAIINWELPPGEQVTEMHLSIRTGFGRASVRAALARLSHEHLVITIPRRGYQVAPITFKYVTDVFGVRLVLEPAAAKQVAARGDSAIADQLDAINERCRYEPGPYDAARYRLANKEFHVAMARATGNDRLADITSASLDDLQRILYLPQVAMETDRVASTWDEHERIIDAIRRRDSDAAEQAAFAHVELNKVMLIDLLIGTSEIGSINLFHQ
ncbi:MAG: GntR family transcriptional regulator [Chloroflexota bacterium]|nr:GntR family transcriptional regulator [Chloroflexota bacterium]